jgi:hypothetical protein
MFSALPDMPAGRNSCGCREMLKRVQAFWEYPREKTYSPEKDG